MGSDRRTARQVRAGRVLAGLSLRDLAAAANISTSTLCQLEAGATLEPRRNTIHAIRRVLEGYGVDFHSGGWVRYHADVVDIPDEVDDLQPRGSASTRQRAHASIHELQRLIGRASFPDDSPTRKARDRRR